MGRLILIQDYPSGQWMRFQPREIWPLRDAGQVPRKLEEAETRVESDGCWAVLFLTFECAPAFDPALAVGGNGFLPAAWLAFCDKPDRLNWQQVRRRDLGVSSQGRSAPVGAGTGALPPSPAWQPQWTLEEYRQRVDSIQQAIREGQTYQVNLTFPLRAAVEDCPRALLAAMVEAQRASCCAYIEEDDWAVLSASPELFLQRRGSRILTRPMKGTAPRGRTLAEDQEQSRWLAGSEKNRAENLMIADMMRNDLGRVADTGSVRVGQLFRTERYPTLWQMTSSVQARSGASTARLLAAAFPPASTTGAPKVAACRLISQLEENPRGVYTGCIGYLGPGRRAQFNVAIRTLSLDRRRGQAVYGVGSGIVADSDAEAEYRECLLKAEVLIRRPPDFQLLETMLWRRGRIGLLKEHLRRLQESARYFEIPVSPERAIEALRKTCDGLGAGLHRIRLLVDRAGGLSVEASPLQADELKRPLTLGLARNPVDSSDPFLFHKTTRRSVYQQALASRPDCDDVILYNQAGELTETALGNLLLRAGSGWATPHLDCGLLAGTFRARLLARGAICQARIKVEDLPRHPSELRLINSVRGIVRVARIKAD